MASAEAIAAIQSSKCANSRRGNRPVRGWLQQHGIPLEWAEAGFGAFNCVHRFDPEHTGGACAPCTVAEAAFIQLLYSLELAQPPVWAHDEHMLMSIDRMTDGVMLASDEAWTAWRKRPGKRQGFLPGVYGKKLQPLRTFLMELDAGELCTAPGPFKDT